MRVVLLEKGSYVVDGKRHDIPAGAVIEFDNDSFSIKAEHSIGVNCEDSTLERHEKMMSLGLLVLLVLVGALMFLLGLLKLASE